jgi:hypothetical protein
METTILHRTIPLKAALIAALSLSACSTGISKLPSVNAPTGQTTRPPATSTLPPGAFRKAPAQDAAGLEGVLGTRAGVLTRRFGAARIDLTEGDARKLQFLGSGCVLDIFLYPDRPGAEPLAAHVETRSRKDGSKTDPARCIREVESQR